jgi:hypothetical protein
MNRATAIKADLWHAESEWVQNFAAKISQYADDAKLALGFKADAKMTNCQIVFFYRSRFCAGDLLSLY